MSNLSSSLDMNISVEKLWRFSMWLESADGDAGLKSVLPDSLKPFLEFKEQYNAVAHFSLIEVAFLFTEILMIKLDSKHERFLSLEEWLDSLSKYYRAETERWNCDLRNRLSVERPAVKVSAAVYHNGLLRTEIPSSEEAYKLMVKEDQIRFYL